ncbi:Ankyrin repeats (3 copies) [Legionella donaldsonii]|uniref:Ankyrin repeats (3 copies) n=1 Tax=Legionella donaldsonii TaxID=45060 RepID=A0A378J7C9_9GAMM|nr:hypothetical protein [Legionella donaldsonii]STX43359.1 Ankyrin repeats (3 copies) [Legionella donaldsonii]
MPRIIELPNFRYPTSLLEDKAFAANPEVSIQTDILDSFSKTSLYDDANVLDENNLISNAGKQALKAQFNTLLNKLAQKLIDAGSGTANDIQNALFLRNDSLRNKINNYIDNGNATGTRIKRYIEKLIYVIEHSEQAESEKKAAFTKLFSNITSCGPGLEGELIIQIGEVSGTATPEAVFSKLRVELFEKLVSELAHEVHAPEQYEKHVRAYAAQLLSDQSYWQQLNIPEIKQINDAQDVHLDGLMAQRPQLQDNKFKECWRAHFKEIFVKNYNREALIDRYHECYYEKLQALVVTHGIENNNHYLKIYQLLEQLGLAKKIFEAASGEYGITFNINIAPPTFAITDITKLKQLIRHSCEEKLVTEGYISGLAPENLEGMLTVLGQDQTARQFWGKVFLREIKKGHENYEPIFLELMVQGKNSEEDVLYLIKDVVQTGRVALLGKVIDKIDGQQLLDFQSKYGRDFLKAAVSSGSAGMVNFILTRGKNYESEAHEAAKLALQLQDNNAAIEIFHNLSQYIQEPQQFFYQAIEEGKEEIALELMSVMANSNDLAISYKGGKSLVQLAVEKGSFKLANALLDKLVKENKHEILHKSDERDNTILTALYDFIQGSSEQEKSAEALQFAQKFMGYLGTQNANNPLQNETKLCKLSQDLFNHGRTMVHEIARSGNINLMRFIDFVNPAWLTLPDRNGEPPIAYAANSLQLDMVSFLANKTPGDRFGSALQFALNHCSRAGNNPRAETIAINLITRMDVNSLRQERRTKLSENEYEAIPPFVKVLNIGHTQLAELLVTRGAGTLGSHPRSALGVWFNDVADRDPQFRALRRAIVDISSGTSNSTITDKCIRQIFTEPKLVGAITTLEQWGQQAARQNKGVFSGFKLFGSKPDSRFVQLMHEMVKYGLHVESTMDVKKYRLPALNSEASIYKEKNGQLHLEHDTRNNTLTLVYTNRDKKESMLGTIHNLTEKNLDFMVPDLAKTLNNIIMAPDNAPKHWNWLRSYEQTFNPQPNSFAIR